MTDMTDMTHIDRLQSALDLLDDMDNHEVSAELRADAERYHENARDALNRARRDALLAALDSFEL